MKKRKPSQHRRSLEMLASQANESLATARQLYDDNEAALAYVLARQTFPLAVYVASRRWSKTESCSAKYDMVGNVRAFGAARRLSGDACERLRRATAIVAMGWEGPQDVDVILHAANHLMRASEGKTAKASRLKAKASQPSSVRRWSTAAIWLLTFGAIGCAP